MTTDHEDVSGHADDLYAFADTPSIDINAEIAVTDAALDQAWEASNGTNGESGIITVTVVGKKACSAQRLGVVGAFEPPVTG